MESSTPRELATCESNWLLISGSWVRVPDGAPQTPCIKLQGVFLLPFFRDVAALRCTIGDSNSPGPASAYRGAKTVLRTVFRARESPRFNGSMMGMRVEKRVVDPYSTRYYKTEGVFSACRLLFIGEIFSIAFYKELRLNKLEVVDLLCLVPS